ncbi:MAG: helix-turn-helix domain-containing protein [Porticoccaceae bacterium]
MLGFGMAEEKRQKYKHCSEELLGAVAVNVINLRRQQGLSQEGLAERSGMHRTFISLIERRGRNITLGAVEALAQALGVRPYELLMGDGVRSSTENKADGARSDGVSCK